MGPVLAAERRRGWNGRQGEIRCEPREVGRPAGTTGPVVAVGTRKAVPSGVSVFVEPGRRRGRRAGRAPGGVRAIDPTEGFGKMVALGLQDRRTKGSIAGPPSIAPQATRTSLCRSRSDLRRGEIVGFGGTQGLGHQASRRVAGEVAGSARLATPSRDDVRRGRRGLGTCPRNGPGTRPARARAVGRNDQEATAKVDRP